MPRIIRVAALALALAGLAAGTAIGQEASKHVLRDAAEGKIKPAKITVRSANGATITKTMPFISAGTLKAAEIARFSAPPDLADEAQADGSGSNLAGGGQSADTVGCRNRTSHGNVRVNQDCTYRRQAEEKIVYNPANPNNLLAGQNDSRVGFNQCGIDWSTDNGVHWGDLLPPFRQRLNDPASLTPTTADPNSHTILGGPGTFHTYDAGSDPAPAFDAHGRGFFTCVAFDIASNAGLVYATQSPAAAQGSFFYNLVSPPSPGATSPGARHFIVDEENDPRIALDKPFIVADTFTRSPNVDNVYATWTVFVINCPPGVGECSSPIFGSMSTDHGLTWSTPEEISGNSPTLCFFGDFFDPTRNPHDCDFDQGSDPAPQPNGDLVVIFNNGNTPAGNPNGQQLGVVCHPSGSSPAGTAHMHCGSPAKVGDDILVGEPLCDFGRGPEECVPGPWIRTNDFPRIAVNPDNGDLYATWQDYRNGEYDIQLANSTDGGRTWSTSSTVNPDSDLDHYFPADAVSPSWQRDRVGVSYYRSGRVPNENNTPSGGFAPGQPGVQQASSDYVLAGGKGTRTPFRFTVLSPKFAPPDGNQAGFNGDYSGLAINRDGEAHPIWSDTRNTNPFPLNGVVHDEDVFTEKVTLPGEDDD